MSEFPTDKELKERFQKILEEIEKLPKEDLQELIELSKQRAEFFPEWGHLVTYLESLEKAK